MPVLLIALEKPVDRTAVGEPVDPVCLGKAAITTDPVLTPPPVCQTA